MDREPQRARGRGAPGLTKNGVAIRISMRAHRILKRVAFEREVSMAEIIEGLVTPLEREVSYDSKN